MYYRVLGPLEVENHGELLPLGGAKQRALLSVLLLHANEVVPRDVLIEDLWGQRGREGSVHGLEVQVSRLRKTLRRGRDEGLVTRPTGYRLSVGADEFDLLCFDRLFEDGRQALRSGSAKTAAETLREALALWRGRPFEDVGYESFAQVEIQRLEERRLAALETRIDADLALGRHDELAAELEALVGKHPLRERLRRQLMIAFYRSGRQGEALDAYLEVRRVLVQELGIEPSHALRQLEQAILRQDPALDASASASGAAAPTCSQCGQRNADDARFCSSCAAPLVTELSAHPTVRKTVTVLFCDMVESTPLGERLDPEWLRRVLARWHESMRTALERHGGTVEKFVGDAVMAVFGLPVVHEDDALRAVRAAADMRLALGAINAELDDYGVEIQVRTAVNTGDVVAGDGETLVTGDAVNVAARLEQSAEAGEILLGEQTVRLLGEAAIVEPVSDLPLKGKAGPVPAWRLLSVLPDVPAFAVPPTSPFVGRGEELAALSGAFERALAERRCQLVIVIGEPGIGKSRLLREAVAAVDEHARVLVGRCLPYGEGITYWPLVEIVKELGEEPRKVISELLSESESGKLVAELVATAVGAGERPGSIDETHWAVRRLLEALAGERPLVVVLEDVHWAEPTFLDLLEYLAGFSAKGPILLLASARPELLETRSMWARPRPNSLLLPLEPLAESEVDALIDARLEAGAYSTRLRARVLEAAEGNPLFVEQLLAMEARGGDEDSALVVPPTLQALLAARIDRLEVAERAMLERAAVEGRGFHRGAVAELSPPRERAAVGARLLALARMELIRPDRSEFADEDGYRFEHVLIRDAAYESTPKELRAELHERYADWLERRAGDRIREYEEILGYHLEQACRFRRELGRLDEATLDLARRAAMWLASAGRRARARLDWPAAARLLSRATSLLPEGDADRVQLLPDLGESIGGCGDHRSAIAVLEEAIERAEAAGDERTRSYALLFRIFNRTRIEPGFTAEEALRETKEALLVFENLGDDVGQAFAWLASGVYNSSRGHHAEASKSIERALAHAIAAGDERLQTQTRAWIGSCLFEGAASLDEAFSYAESLAPAAIEGRRVLAGLLSGPLARAHARRGQFETARTLIAEEAALHEERGNTLRATVSAALGFGEIELLAGDPAAAEGHLRQGCSALEEAGETNLLSALAAQLGEAVDAQGRHAEAERHTRISEEAAAHDDYYAQIQWRSVRAKAFAGQGRIVEGERLAGEAVTLAQGTDDIYVHGDALMALAEVLLLAERPEEAIPAIHEALRLYEQKGSLVSADKARALLGELRMLSES